MMKNLRAGKNPPVDARLVVVLGTLGAASSAVLIKLSSAPPQVMAALRLWMAVLILLPIVLWRARRELFSLRGRDVAACALSGVFLALHFLCWFFSLRHTSVAVSTVLVSTDVIFTAAGYRLVLKGRLPRLAPLAIAVTLLGSVVIALGQGAGNAAGLLGGALALAGAVFGSVYTLIGRVQRGHLSTLAYTFVCYLACALCLSAACLFTRAPLWGHQPANYLYALGMAVLATLLGHSLFSWSLRYLSPAYVATVKLGEPVLSALLAVFVLGEWPAPVQLGGAGLVLLGILLFTRLEARERPEKT